jgi:nucleoside-diphosphate-sugar epimerase
METVLITGASGYIGSVLIGTLLNANYKVIAFDNLMYEKTSLLQYCNNVNFEFVLGDVREKQKLSEYVKKADIIIPLAALIGADLCKKNSVDAELVNYLQIKFICEIKKDHQKILYTMTNSGYGTTDGTSFCTEETPMNAVSLYGTTKLEAENIVRKQNNFVSFRLATVFGCSTRPRNDLLVNNMVLRAIKDRYIVLYENQNMRNYVHVRDVSDAILFVLQNWEKTKNEIFNLGNDSINMNKLQLCEKIKEYIPFEIIKAEYTKDPDQRNYIVSSDKLKKRGFEAKRNLDEGIRELMIAYKMIDHPQYANY